MNKIKNSTCKAIIATLLSMVITFMHAPAQDWQSQQEAGILFGLSQPLVLNGFNIEGNYIHHRLILDYSHGAALQFTGDLLTDAMRDQQVTVFLPFTTGFGVGYRITEWINLRVEPKWHRFNLYYEAGPRSASNLATSFDTYTVGLGLYGLWKPFKNAESAVKGITVAPSIRWWPTVGSSVEGNQVQYLNRQTERIERLDVLGPGIGFSPWIANISVGYLLAW
jgi:hypothetical protein